MRDWRVICGVVLGVSLAAVFITVGGEVPTLARPAKAPDVGALLSDSHGQIEELVIQYVPESAAVVERVYRDFLSQLPDDVTVHVLCPDQAAFDDLCERVGRTACTRLQPLTVGHAMTTWSRDRWLALASNDTTTLVAPLKEDGHEVWPARAGDQMVNDDLAAVLTHVRAARSPLEFDGGDFVADQDTVFVTPRVVERNVPARVSRKALHDELTQLLNRRVVILDEAPDHHAGMYMTLIGDGTAVVGDPSLGRRSLKTKKRSYDFSKETQRLFDAVAAQCQREGYRVVRMPVLPGKDGRTYETPLNVIMDQRAGERSVFVPTYRHNRALNRAAAAVWTSLGFVVKPVDCTDAYVHAGSLRCLVNILRRGVTRAAGTLARATG